MIPLFKVYMHPGLEVEMTKVLYSGYIGQGPKVDEFERQLKPWLGENVLTVNSCTSALHLALHMCGIGYKDDVISTPMTCSATNTPIKACGGDIIWADINPMTGNIDPTSIVERITRWTKAIVVVHWAGSPCDMKVISEIGHKFKIPVIQDCAHAFGAKYKGLHLSKWSRFSCYSFQAIKVLTTVDGGALVCRDKEDYQRGKLLRWYGLDREGSNRQLRCEQNIKEAGFKFHMNDVNATIGIHNLQGMPSMLKAHRVHAKIYLDEFKDLKKVKCLEQFPDGESSYWVFTILVDDVDKFISFMEEHDIAASQVHARNDRHSAFTIFPPDIPNTVKFYERQVSIPVGWWLSEGDVQYITDTVKEYDKV